MKETETESMASTPVVAIVGRPMKQLQSKNSMGYVFLLTIRTWLPWAL